MFKIRQATTAAGKGWQKRETRVLNWLEIENGMEWDASHAWWREVGERRDKSNKHNRLVYLKSSIYLYTHRLINFIISHYWLLRSVADVNVDNFFPLCCGVFFSLLVGGSYVYFYTHAYCVPEAIERIIYLNIHDILKPNNTVRILNNAQAHTYPPCCYFSGLFHSRHLLLHWMFLLNTLR